MGRAVRLTAKEYKHTSLPIILTAISVDRPRCIDVGFESGPRWDCRAREGSKRKCRHRACDAAIMAVSLQLGFTGGKFDGWEVGCRMASRSSSPSSCVRWS